MGPASARSRSCSVTRGEFENSVWCVCTNGNEGAVAGDTESYPLEGLTEEQVLDACNAWLVDLCGEVESSGGEDVATGESFKVTFFV